MGHKDSKLATVRRIGATQVDARRANILDAAERRFLQNGLEHTTMADVAEEAGITRVTLYRYFSDRDTIAFEIAIRTLRRIMSVNIGEPARQGTGDAYLLERLEAFAHAMIRNFDELRDAYRYLGMFDYLYTDRYPSEELATWYKQQMAGLRMSEISDAVIPPELPHADRVVMVINTIMSSLQRFAARGELMAAEQGVPLEEQLRLLDEMIGLYFERLIASVPRAGRRTRT